MSEILVTTEQMQAIDAQILDQGIYSEEQLVEHVARGLFAYLLHHDIIQSFRANDRRIAFLIGNGNNGSDGLSLARLLRACGIRCDLLYMTEAPKNSLNARLRQSMEDVHVLGSDVASLESVQALVDRAACIIDCCIGLGANRPLGGIYHQVISAVNDSDAFKIAIDIPTGAWESVNQEAKIFRADLTLCIGINKVLLYQPHVRRHCGKIATIWVPFLSHQTDFPLRDGACIPNIAAQRLENPQDGENSNLSKPAAQDGMHPPKDPSVQRFNLEDLGRLITLPPQSSHKNTRGSVLVCAGSPRMPGAAQLCASAALASYAGSVHMHSDRFSFGPETKNRKEEQPVADWQQAIIAQHPALLISEDSSQSYASIVIGPGWGRGRDAFFARVIDQSGGVILDADAFIYCKDHIAAIRNRPAPTIMTPHPKECARLLAVDTDAILTAPIPSAKRLSEIYDAIVLLKGHVTHIVYKEAIAIVDGMCPSLACAGSGDVLAGIIAGFATLSGDLFSQTVGAALVHLGVGQYFFQKNEFPPSSRFAVRIPEITAQYLSQP